MTSRSIIHVQGLTVFHGLRPVLRNMDFVINHGEFIFLTGETGSGKTSLLKTLYADLPLKAGEVQVAGSAWGHLKSLNSLFYAES
jgi:cell division transport system ATP-binding protein